MDPHINVQKELLFIQNKTEAKEVAELQIANYVGCDRQSIFYLLQIK
jgi:hypothetical protein